MNLNVINYIVHCRTECSGRTVFVIVLQPTLQQAEVTNRVSDWPKPTNSKPPKTVLDEMTNTTFPRFNCSSADIKFIICNGVKYILCSILLHYVSANWCTTFWCNLSKMKWKHLGKKNSGQKKRKKNSPPPFHPKYQEKNK